MVFQGFGKDALNFLNALAGNNRKEWFNEYKSDYEDWIRTPALQFIESMQEPLQKISPHFVAIARKSGGSMMRPYRDTRFSNDKSPYKTNVGIQFRHEAGKDVHAPGFYVHIEPGGCFLGAGLWKPDSQALMKIRTAIVEHDKEYAGILKSSSLKSFNWEGDTLIRPPKGFNCDHSLIQEIKRKDFLVSKAFDEQIIFSNNMTKILAKEFAKTKDLMRFLCLALELPF